MGQNTSTAVMNQRVEPADSLDDFPSPPWATRALCEHVITPRGNVWEPTCNRGYMARPLSEYFDDVYCTDVHDYGYEQMDRVEDFLHPLHVPDVDWVVSNPPFRLGEEFIHQALRVANVGVAMFQRTTFLETKGRYERLFKHNPPAYIWQFSERVPLLKGRVEKNASTATAYCWMIWYPGIHRRSHFRWIPPCRKDLEKQGDYDDRSKLNKRDEESQDASGDTTATGEAGQD